MSENEQVQEYEARSMAGFFGAPLSWVALFGALIGAMAIVPLIFYPGGGGYASAGMIIIAPAAGMLLGPWAGAISATIGGVIGMMISPGAYPLGIVDIILSGTLISFTWGFMQPRFRKWLVALFVIHLVVYYVFPYYWPAEAAGLERAQEPEWFFSMNAFILGTILFIVVGPTIWRWFQSDTRWKMIVGLVGTNFFAVLLWEMPWVYPWRYLIRYPYTVSLVENYLAWIVTIIPIVAITSVISYFLIRAVQKAGLREIPYSWIEAYDFKWQE